MKFKAGDIVNYNPTILSDKKMHRARIERILEAGTLLRFDSAILEGLDHWVPCHELEKINEI